MNRQRTLRRIQEIMQSAPWSNHDLLAGLALTGVGLELLLQPTLFDSLGGAFSKMAGLADETIWGGLFTVLGMFSIIATLWCQKPPFLMRLFGRMSVAFGFLTLAGNHITHRPIPLAFIVYLYIALWSLWGVIRTGPSGR